MPRDIFIVLLAALRADTAVDYLCKVVVLNLADSRARMLRPT